MARGYGVTNQDHGDPAGVTNRILLQLGAVMRLGAVALLMAVAILRGCGDATGPGTAKVEVAVMSVSGPAISQPSQSETSISCGVTFSAQAAGAGCSTWAE